MLNLPLLYWATDETGDPGYADIANRQFRTTRRFIIRPDYAEQYTLFGDYFFLEALA